MISYRIILSRIAAGAHVFYSRRSNLSNQQTPSGLCSWAVTFIPMPMRKTVCRTRFKNTWVRGMKQVCVISFDRGCTHEDRSSVHVNRVDSSCLTTLSGARKLTQPSYYPFISLSFQPFNVNLWNLKANIENPDTYLTVCNFTTFLNDFSGF